MTRRVVCLVSIFITLILSSCEKDEQKERTPVSANKLIVTTEDEITTSDNASLNITIVYRNDLIPRIPDFNDLFSPVRIINREEEGRVENEYYIREINLFLENLLPGDYFLNNFSIDLYRDDVLIETLESEVQMISVKTRLLEGDLFIDEFEEMEDQNYSLIFIVTGLAALILLCVFSYLRFFRNRDHVAVQKTDFLFRLSEIEKIEEEKSFYSHLHNLIKEFLDNTVFLSVQSKTTEEFITMVSGSPIISESVKVNLFDFIQRCDRITFGRNTNEKSNRLKDIQFCRDFIAYIGKQINGEEIL